ncbi:MAG TPA: hypothetical protein VFS10_08510 [Pyrinomonadaceae bacterium]|nr:hypothetical protein [Pyrinomonadaceae bacterium]
MLKLSDEELWRVVKVDFADYRKEAVEVAAEELERRGLSYAGHDGPPANSAVKIHAPGDQRLSLTQFIVLAVTIGLLTFLAYPVISYLSPLAYGLPASIFMALGYELWYALRRRNTDVAAAFSVGYIPPVVFCLMVLMWMAPLHTALILVQFFGFWLIHQYLTRKRKRYSLR